MTAVNSVPPPCNSGWLPEDDLLLRNSIEAGASLEALARGAVKFSRRFTFNELKNRWHSLLYDPVISAQSSASMIELELSGFPLSKNGRLDHSKGNDKLPEKRKIQSIRNQYYAMRKRNRIEFLNSQDVGFLDKNDLHTYSRDGLKGHVALHNQSLEEDTMFVGCTAEDLGLEETDMEILRRAFSDPAIANGVDSPADAYHSGQHISGEENRPDFSVRTEDLYKISEQDPSQLRNDLKCSVEPSTEPKSVPTLGNGSGNDGNCLFIEETSPPQLLDGNLFKTGELQMKRVSTSDAINEYSKQSFSGFGGKRHLDSPGSDGSSSLHGLELSSPLPRPSPLRETEDVSAPNMLVNGNTEERAQVAVEAFALPLGGLRKVSLPGNIGNGSLCGDGPVGADCINSKSVLEGELPEISDSPLNFPNEEELLVMDIDERDTTFKSCYVDSNLVSPIKCMESEFCNAEVVSASSISSLDANSLRRTEGNMICTINTEWLEVPCNDDIFLLIHTDTPFASSSREPTKTDSHDPMPSADKKDTKEGLTMTMRGNKYASSVKWSQVAAPSVLPVSVSMPPVVGCATKPELPGDNSRTLLHVVPKKVTRKQFQAITYTAPVEAVHGMLEQDASNVAPRTGDVPASFSKLKKRGAAIPVERILAEPSAYPSTSEHDDPASDGDVPYFSDIEAMILDMDLPSDEDSCLDSLASRYQHEECKRAIIRLEQSARFSMQRAMTSQGALAMLYGRNLKHYIKKSEVIIGRSTSDVDVDIDLRKEGRANKISRRQASIKVETDGSFSLKNLGKSLISVNGEEVASGQVLTLRSSCLIEIKGMCFVFEINNTCVRRYLEDLTRKTQGKTSAFGWSRGDQV